MRHRAVFLQAFKFLTDTHHLFPLRICANYGEDLFLANHSVLKPVLKPKGIFQVDGTLTSNENVKYTRILKLEIMIKRFYHI